MCESPIETTEFKTSICGHVAHMECFVHLLPLGGCCVYPPTKATKRLFYSLLTNTPAPIEQLKRDGHWWTLARLYRNGICTKRDIPTAVQCAHLAALQGHHDALVERATVDAKNEFVHLERAVNWLPNNGTASVYIYRKSSDPVRKEKALQDAIAAQHPAGYYLKAFELVQAENYTDALPLLYKSAKSLYPSALEVLVELNRVRGLLGDAMAWARRRYRLDIPVSPMFNISMGLIEKMQGNIPAAIEEFTSASNRNDLGVKEATLYLEALAPSGRECDKDSAVALFRRHAEPGFDFDEGFMKFFFSKAQLDKSIR